MVRRTNAEAAGATREQLGVVSDFLTAHLTQHSKYMKNTIPLLPSDPQASHALEDSCGTHSTGGVLRRQNQKHLHCSTEFCAN